jgi:hypothetical protein
VEGGGRGGRGGQEEDKVESLEENGGEVVPVRDLDAVPEAVPDVKHEPDEFEPDLEEEATIVVTAPDLYKMYNTLGMTCHNFGSVRTKARYIKCMCPN